MRNADSRLVGQRVGVERRGLDEPLVPVGKTRDHDARAAFAPGRVHRPEDVEPHQFSFST